MDTLACNELQTPDIMIYMAKVTEKAKAISLRKQGCSVSEIVKRVRVSKSTVSLWCRDISLTKEQQENLRAKMVLAGSSGRQKGADVNRNHKEKQQKEKEEEAQKVVGRLSKREKIILFLGLYWGEGSKNRERKFVFTNSDVSAVLCVMKSLQVLGVHRDDFVVAVYINESHKDRVSVVESFWLDALDLERSQMRKTIFVTTKTRKQYENRDNYFGVVRLMVKKSSKLKDFTMGGIKHLKKQFE